MKKFKKIVSDNFGAALNLVLLITFVLGFIAPFFGAVVGVYKLGWISLWYLVPAGSLWWGIWGTIVDLITDTYWWWSLPSFF